MAGDNSILALTAKMRLENEEFKRKLKEVQGSTKAFEKNMKMLGGVIAGAFSVGAIVNFGKEAFNLASEAEGIRIAFNRLNDPTLLENLRKATKNTVSDLQLMKAAVKADNFNIPLSQLAKYFEFATSRARDTGESVDYLVESIVLGVARKSIPILDNLGISSVEVQSEFAKTGDMAVAVSNIISKSMSDAGDSIDTSSEKVAQMNTTWANFKEFIGTKLAPTVTFVTELLNAFLKKIEQGPTAAEEKFEQLNNRIKELPINEQKKEWESVAKLQDDYIQGFYDELVALDKITTYTKQERKDQEARREFLYEQLDIQKSLYDLIINQINKKDKLLEVEEKVTKENKKQYELTQSQKWVYDQIITQQQTIGRISEEFGKEKKIDWGLDLEMDEEEFPAEDKFYEKLNQLKEKTKEFSEEITAMLQNTFADAISTIADSFGEALVSGNIEEAFKEVLKGFAGFLSKMGQMMILYGVAQSAFWKSFAAGPLGAASLIAAGVAMVAIGGAIKALASKGPETSGMGSGSVGSFTKEMTPAYTELRGNSIKVAQIRDITKRGHSLRY